MIWRISRFFLDEKDIFILFFGVFLIAALILNLEIPFRKESLAVLFLFLLVTRSMVSQYKLTGYVFITLAGLLFSLFLSPYGLAIYLFLAMIGYTKLRS